MEVWENKTNVFSFIREASEILLNGPFLSYSISELEKIPETLRVRANGVATIKGKTMALSKLLRAAGAWICVGYSFGFAIVFCK